MICMERFLTERTPETMHDVVVEITRQPPWSHQFVELDRVQLSRLRTRLSKDILNNSTLVLISLGHPDILRRLFGA